MVMSVSQAQQRVPQPGVPVHHGLRQVVPLGRAALDQVRGEGERAAGEPDQRPRAQLAHQRGHRLGDEPHIARLQAAQPGQVPFVPDGLAEHRADTRLDVDVQPHRVQRDHDVAEQDGRVNRVPAQRLQRDLGDHIGQRARLEHRHATAGAAVLRQRAARLAHVPDRRVGHRLAAAGAQERGVSKRGGRRSHAFDALTGPHPPSRIRAGDIGTRRPRSTDPHGPRATIRGQCLPQWSPGPGPLRHNGEEGGAVTRLVRICPPCRGNAGASAPGRSSAPAAGEYRFGRDCPDASGDGGRRRRTLSL